MLSYPPSPTPNQPPHTYQHPFDAPFHPDLLTSILPNPFLSCEDRVYFQRLRFARQFNGRGLSFEELVLLILHHHPRVAAAFDLKGWNNTLLGYNSGSLDIVPPLKELGLLWPLILVVMRCSVPAVPKAKRAGKLAKAFLEARLESHNFEVSNNLSSCSKLISKVQMPLYPSLRCFE
ncbi:hypothetical protein SK128_008421 [Halocaridina rubra]|uniref:Uncharacterized protein n=1 Tax=Halocaridina rubra TaxID=373956 RepID=A0AAN8XGI8_HALRR